MQPVEQRGNANVGPLIEAIGAGTLPLGRHLGDAEQAVRARGSGQTVKGALYVARGSGAQGAVDDDDLSRDDPPAGVMEADDEEEFDGFEVEDPEEQ